MNPLNSIPAGIVVGVVLAIVVFVIMPGSGFNEKSLARWIHIIAGVMWVGLLYYVVVAQIPGLAAAAAADKGGPGGAGINKYVAPRVLLWFRWAAVATWLTGAWYLVRSNNLVGAFTLGLSSETLNPYHLVIGTGAWIGTIMLFNVWVVIRCAAGAAGALIEMREHAPDECQFLDSRDDLRVSPALVAQPANARRVARKLIAIRL